MFTDNNQVLYAINDKKSRNHKVMGCLREIFWTLFVFVCNLLMTARRIPSEENILPDFLSRFTSLPPRNVGIRLLTADHFNCRFVDPPVRGGTIS